MFNVFSVDPSLRACGWTSFACTDEYDEARYLESGCIRSKGIEEGEDPVIDSLKGKRSKSNDWISRLDETVNAVLCFVPESSYKIGLIELPSTYSGGKGDVAAASGAIMKLMGVVFAFRERMLHEHGFNEVILVPVITWKGQTKKDVTARRVLRNWKCSHVTDHNEMDAIGIADWYLRRKMNYKPI